jgi:hypothetical protein
MAYKTPTSHFKALKSHHAGIIQDPPFQDTLVSVIYRDMQEDRPAVTGALVIAGTQTRHNFPNTNKEPLHFVKIYHPGARTNTQTEYDRTAKVAASTKLSCFPTPLGAKCMHHSPFGIDDNQVLQIQPTDELNTYRSKVIPGVTLSVISPLPKGHYLPDSISEEMLATSNKASSASLHKLWDGLEAAYADMKELHAAGCVHCDGHRHNLLFVNQGATLKPCFIDYETARFKEDMEEEEWKRRVDDDFDDLYREAIVLQHTQLGPQTSDLGINSRHQEAELFTHVAGPSHLAQSMSFCTAR